MIRVVEKILIVLTALVVLAALFIMLPCTQVLISMAIMNGYSASCAEEALTTTEGIALDIPGGGQTSTRDWYPFVMTFHPGYSFGRSVGRRASLSILYNFGDFDPCAGCSTLYDPSSPYYSSFYGAYLVKADNGIPYGFDVENGVICGINGGEISAVAKYDYQRLVLSDFGLTKANAVFDFSVQKISENVGYAGSDGWYRVDATLTVNGCAHKKIGFVQSYLQYGMPAFEVEEDLAPTEMFGRVYAKYLEEKGVSVFFYIIAADKEVLEDTDREILSKSTIALTVRSEE